MASENIVFAAIYYTLEESGLSEKGDFWDLCLVSFWEPKWPKRSPEWYLKNSSENRSILDPFWDPFWSHFGVILEQCGENPGVIYGIGLGAILL